MCLFFQERNFEYSELVLYQNVILQEAGYVDEALNHLSENKEHIVDKLSFLEYKCKYLSCHASFSSVLHMPVKVLKIISRDRSRLPPLAIMSAVPIGSGLHWEAVIPKFAEA